MAKYSTEFKMKLVKEYLEGKIGYRELAKKYNIPNKRAIQTWVSAYKTQGYDGLKVSRRNNNYSLEYQIWFYGDEKYIKKLIILKILRVRAQIYS